MASSKSGGCVISHTGRRGRIFRLEYPQNLIHLSGSDVLAESGPVLAESGPQLSSLESAP